jgi:uncharacterized glyoxalase superfamily protein PhnB
MATPKSMVSTEIIPYIFYRDVPAALDWLTRTFGFAETMRTTTPNRAIAVSWGEGSLF